ncbi:hypothetical protein LTR27_000699 [Elasticomyces elasticus]|nr:hypothetical protein LTR27_000699 [Elasticomyces elasticus]
MPVTTRAQAVASASKDRLEAAKALTATARKEFRDWVEARPKGRRTKSQLRGELYAYLEATEVEYRNLEILAVLSPQSKDSKTSVEERALDLNDVYNRPDGWD